MSVTFKQLEAFVHVADLASFRRAAELLNTTQPNISARIASLEARLGQVLMERDAGSVRMTPQGEALLEKAREVLRAVEGLITAAKDDTLYEGVLRLGVSELVVHTWLRTYLRRLKERFPNVLVELNVDFSTTLSKALFNRSLDLTLQSGPFTREASGNVTLDIHRLVWVAAPALKIAAPLTCAALAEHPILSFARGTEPYIQTNEHFTGIRARIVPTTNIATVLQMTIDGLGVACLPQAMAADPLSDGSLVPLDYEWVPAPLRFAARYDADTAPAYVAQAAVLAQEVGAAYDKDM